MATWGIETTERNTSDGGVIVAHYFVTDEETVGTGDDAVTYKARGFGSVQFEPDASDASFISYDSLTEADVVGWVKAAVNVSAIEAALTANITEQKTPTTASGVPW